MTSKYERTWREMAELGLVEPTADDHWHVTPKGDRFLRALLTLVWFERSTPPPTPKPTPPRPKPTPGSNVVPIR